ncbi:hypothetical protein M2451_000819 [Dysgonomonas sp. PFB1-18]|uniref:hypothetical protein n=1 Tax=unclassified Dysgonomonas TaxID=2630389 RepID=UPI0024760425|nr:MULTISPECIES: hypothetical protein [unclassified Dysgonomonas]MDH6308508.1 hypothetical protein [Dysgonomonas sp. PF1-14]MDH6338009.1 hypothetical protein [Dysgonomonas sp. PF1-16]MDH6379506.1 hypothetical protein [Dysgonomonas sp. PFB1-18]MDH6396837.1 hypothetical protein [Dysgonomonas sp. PF1-23]
MKILKHILLTGLIVSLFCGCGKDEEENIIPVYPVNFKINLVVDNVLRTPGSYKEYVKGSYPILAGESLGYAGLIVVNSIYATNTPDLFAFDLSCPNEKMAHIRVKGSGNFTATCEKCGKVYDLMSNGRITDGSSKLHLQRYRVVSTAEADVFYVTR